MPSNDDHNYLEQILRRLDLMENRIEFVQKRLVKVEQETDSIQTVLNRLQIAIVQLNENLHKTESLEKEIRAIHDKLNGYDVKLAGLELIKGMLIAVLVAVIPGFLAIAFEIIKLFVKAQ